MTIYLDFGFMKLSYISYTLYFIDSSLKYT